METSSRSKKGDSRKQRYVRPNLQAFKKKSNVISEA